MKNLHASLISKMIRQEKIGNVKELLMLVGPETDIVALIKDLIFLDINKKDSDRSIIEMTGTLFRYLCLHYPDKAEEFLREIDSEIFLDYIISDDPFYTYTYDQNILEYGYLRYKNFKENIQLPKDVVNNKKINTLIAIKQQEVLGKVAYEYWIPAFEKFFNRFQNIYFYGERGNMYRLRNCLNNLNIIKDYNSYNDYIDSQNKPPITFYFLEPEKICFNINLKEHIESLKKEFEKVKNIKTVINFSEKNTSIFNICIAFNPKNKLKKDIKDIDGMLYGISSYNYNIAIACKNNKLTFDYSLPFNRNSEVRNSVIKHSHRDSRFRGSYFEIYIFEKIYKQQIIDFVKQIITICGADDIENKPVEVIRVTSDNPLLKQAIEFYKNQ